MRVPTNNVETEVMGGGATSIEWAPSPAARARSLARPTGEFAAAAVVGYPPKRRAPSISSSVHSSHECGMGPSLDITIRFQIVRLEYAFSHLKNGAMSLHV